LNLQLEANPFLGNEPFVCAFHNLTFSQQLRAILRAGAGHDLRIMFPMIADLGELRRAKSTRLKPGRK
jgi:phosphoenolpyruvate-protein kinase (PTS system EI component)